MNIKDIETIDDLRKLGNVTEIKNHIEDIISPLKVASENYENLLVVVLKLKEKWIDFAPYPFISEQAALIYYLTKLEGKQRNKALGITDEHYDPKKNIAKKWFKKISQKIHSDKNGSDEAFIILSKLYKIMKDNSGEEK